MNPKTVKIIKIILCSICAAFFASYLVWAAVAGLGSDEVVCGSLVIDITDSDTYNFINNNDIKDKLSEAHIDPVGRKASHNLADSVEKTINSISFVKNSECYIGDNGVMTLEITQRQPVLMVKTPVEDYYIDSERKKMPVSPHHTALLPVVTGRVKENMAKSLNEIEGLIFRYPDEVKADVLDRGWKANSGQLPQYEVEGLHPRLIDDGTFGRAQEEIAHRRSLHILASRTQQFSCFTRKVWCADCGHVYRRRNARSKDHPPYHYWKCSSRIDGGAHACTGRNVSEVLLKQASCRVLGLETFDEQAFSTHVMHIDVSQSTLAFHMDDGRIVETEAAYDRESPAKPEGRES